MSDDPVITILGRLEMKLDDLDAKVSAARNDQIATRFAIMERVDRLQNAIALIRDDIAVNFGAAHTVKRANDNTREELRALGDVVAAMHRQINRLQTDVRELRGDP